MRSFIPPQISSALTSTLTSTLQRVGAHAVDRAVWHLGLGRQGIRLTGSSLSQKAERWEAEVSGWKASVVAEAAELIAHRALGAIFDLEGGETVTLESMHISWLSSGAASQRAIREPNRGGKIFLEWSLSEREEFRRDVLSNLTTGARADLTIVGCDHDGLGIVQVELEVRALARAQISGVKT